MDELIYQPVRCGELSSYSRASIFGMTYDHESLLVALSVQASNITVEQIHYEIQGQDKYLTLYSTGSGNKYPQARKSHYKVIKSPIPDTNEVSMIMLNESLYKVVKDRMYTHVWYRGEEQFIEELFLRVRSIVYVPVRREWAEYLYQRGTKAMHRSLPLCGELTFAGPDNIREKRNWMSAGFHIGYIVAEREAWEKVISDGLRNREISIS